ncbi:hypothetical protein DFH07DRAFT_906091 [Mycena maculata]|uniref:Uncharacterized protein n=1 Tax=Mycena maculata TaxID=230809 RepID=A0AAD7MTI1_9AGAR|nr:hypothetical protein DFH07DRAFT_906091 [Mycena maculata]
MSPLSFRGKQRSGLVGQHRKKPVAGSTSNQPTTKKRKYWNTATYKYHSLGDYPGIIVTTGTTDSYSTQVGELAHHLVKRFYARTNKRKISPQIAGHEQKQRILRATNQRMADAKAADAVQVSANIQDPPAEHPTISTDSQSLPAASARNSMAKNLCPDEDDLPRTLPRAHHHISESKRTSFNVFDFNALSKIADDPAVEDFLPKLRAHLLSRLLGRAYEGDETDYSPEELLKVTFKRDRIYSHKLMRVNFTTYDGLRNSDSINPRTHSDIMVLSHEDDDERNPHPYWYARAIGVFHAEVRHLGPASNNRKAQRSAAQRIEFLWVRWFGRDLTHKAGWKAKRLHRLGFIDSAEDGTFGFLDPAEVIRGAHIIPAFHYGRTTELLPKSIARRAEEEDQDYVYYYVNPFADRDLFMRYFDTAVGH